MISFVISALSSGSGKTVITCAMLDFLRKMGYNPCAFKCGPDYIDPMFHRKVLNVESHNLDLFLSDEKFVSEQYKACCAGHNSAVCEGVMGLYDGVGGQTIQASAYHVANTLDIPIILVIQPKGSALTLSAQIKGLCEFGNSAKIVGIILNNCSERLFSGFAPIIERETGVSVLGYLPHMKQASFESRHLGLYTADEIKDLAHRISDISNELGKNLDFERMKTLCDRPNIQNKKENDIVKPKVRLAFAQDGAFCFAYAETIEALQKAGAEIVPFSPINDDKLPENINGLYLPGGYPELYAKELSENLYMRECIKRCVKSGMPTIAECGGFLYLGKSIKTENGAEYNMVGVLDGKAEKKNRLVRFGYANMTAMNDSMLFKKGESIPVHEFHYWDSTQNGNDFCAEKPIVGKKWTCGIASDTLYAGFPHLYFAGNNKLIKRFISAMERYK